MENLQSYLAKPDRGTGPGVLVLHAWWGLNPFIRNLCDRFAQEGFVALAPDLYHGRLAGTIPEAEKLRGKLKRDVAAQEIQAAGEELLRLCGSRTLGLVGFSLGGYLGLGYADQPGNPVAAAVTFYGSRGGDYANSRAAFQFHFAETDPYTSASAVKTIQKNLKAAGRPAEFHVYPGTGHWFFESDRPDSYRPEAAKLAWERTLSFLKANIHHV